MVEKRFMNVTPIVKKLKNLNILIVENNIEKRQSMESILNKYGFEKRSFFDDARSALDSILCGTVYDLVILDWNMENTISSKDFCSQVSKLNKSMPIVFITSNSMMDYFQAFEHGAHNIIKTPFDEKDFIKAIWSAVDIETYRRELRLKDLATTKKQVFFRLEQIASQA